MNGLAWLNDLMVWLSRWVPRLTLIKAGNVGVLFGPRGSATTREPGLRFWWPITHDLQLVSTRVRTAEIAAQLHGSEAISLVVMFQFEDARRMLLHLDDVFSVLDDRTQAYLAKFYREGIRNDDLCDCVYSALRDEFQSAGVGVCSVDVAQRGFTIPIKMLSDYAQHSVATLQGGQRKEEQAA